MTEIPADVMKAARAITLDAPLAEDIARAIMAERERCAGWHDAKAKRYREGYEKANAEGLGFISRALEYAEWHELAAHALRNPSAFSAPTESTP